MCCFSRPVKDVSATKIFARMSDKARQYVVYSMKLDAGEDLAMILPIPVPAQTADDAVKFINLEKYEDFFADLKKGFPDPPAGAAGHSRIASGAVTAKPMLEVVSVGSFEASFVPSIKDFSRLDDRFRLPQSAWDELPQYKQFGFAVFKLKKGNKRIHPMAFDFPTADPQHLFFPTVHIHDGKVHDKADFDHNLYAQVDDSQNKKQILYWRESEQHAENFVDIKRAQNLVEPKAHVYLKTIHGIEKNEDTLL